MADITFNIGLPVLLANQGFRIEYKLQSDSVYTLFGIETDQTVTITGLTEGACYDIRITFLSSLSPLVECPPIIKERCIPGGIGCIQINGEIVQTPHGFDIEITFLPPSPYVASCAGYNVYYGPLTVPAGPLTLLQYSTMPSDFTVPGIQNIPYYVAVYAVDCLGNETLCDEDEIDPLEIICTHAIVTDAEIFETGEGYFIKLTVTPSNPTTPLYGITYFQDNLLTTGIGDSGALIGQAAGANPELFIFPITPNLNIQPQNGQLVLKYKGGINDDCNWLEKWEAEYIL